MKNFRKFNLIVTILNAVVIAKIIFMYFIPNIQNSPARCNKTLNEYITKNGSQIKEVIYDYGNGLLTKSEVSYNKIVNTLADGSTIEYTKNNFGDILVQEGTNSSINRNPDLWDKLMSNIFKGF